MRDRLLQRRLVKERSRTQAEELYSREVPTAVETQKSKVQLVSELANVSLSSRSHRAGGL